MGMNVESSDELESIESIEPLTDLEKVAKAQLYKRIAKRRHVQLKDLLQDANRKEGEILKKWFGEVYEEAE